MHFQTLVKRPMVLIIWSKVNSCYSIVGVHTLNFQVILEKITKSLKIPKTQVKLQISNTAFI